MLCGWGVKAGVANCRQICVLPYLSALENAIVFKGALQMFRFTFYFFNFTLLPRIICVLFEEEYQTNRQGKTDCPEWRFPEC